MYRTNVYLDEEQARTLKHIAAEERASMAELIRRAVDSYIAVHLSEQPEWRERLAEFEARANKVLNRNVPPSAIEEDVTAAKRELRRTTGASNRR